MRHNALTFAPSQVHAIPLPLSCELPAALGYKESVSAKCLHQALLPLQEEQREVLDEQVQDKQQAKLQQQKAKVQDARDIAAALAQHRLNEARSAAARRRAALATKALMASQVCCCSFCFAMEPALARVDADILPDSCQRCEPQQTCLQLQQPIWGRQLIAGHCNHLCCI